MGKCEGFVSGFVGFRGIPATGIPFEFEEVMLWFPSLGPGFPDIALEVDTVKVSIHGMLHRGGYTYFLACACSSLSNLSICQLAALFSSLASVGIRSLPDTQNAPWIRSLEVGTV